MTARRPAGLLRHRPGHVLRDRARRSRRRSRRARARSSRSTSSATSRPWTSSSGSACRSWRTPRRQRAPPTAAGALGALGTAATFSFFPSKNLPCLGDGGAVVTDDDDVAALARRLRFHGSEDKRTFTEVGYNSRLDELQAAVLSLLLPELDGWNERRRAAAAAYERLGLGEHAELPQPVDGRRARLPPLRRPQRAPRGDRHGLLPRPLPPPARDARVGRGHARPSRHARGGAHQRGPADGQGPDRGADRGGSPGVRIWVDLTNSPHVLVMRPVVRRARGGRDTRSR